MAYVDKSYSELLREIIHRGYIYDDPNRKGVKRLEIPSYTFRHEFSEGFPAISTKELNYKNVVTELIWFLQGNTNIKYLVDNGCNIWNKDAYKYYLKQLGKSINPGAEPVSRAHFTTLVKNDTRLISVQGYYFGDLGPVYGRQWRDSEGVDQIAKLIQGLIEKPLGTEHIVSSWNPSRLSEMALPPCHRGFQVVVKPLGNNYGFELHWEQRSVDTFLGLPYNIASYATLALILEEITGYKALAIQGDLKKVHLYDNSLSAVRQQLERGWNTFDKCSLKMSAEVKMLLDNYESFSVDDIFNHLAPSDFELDGYKSYGPIVVPMLERDE